MSELIDISGLGKSYDGKRFVLKELSFRLGAGQTAIIYGESGCGKSTLLNIIGLLDSATEGEYLFCGRRVNRRRVNSYSGIRANDIGFVFQTYCLIEALSVRDNVLMPYLYNGQRLTKEVYSELDSLSERLGIASLLDKKAALLSGGEKQRAAIARAMIKKPALLIADEPTGNLDEGNSRLVTEAFRSVAEEGTALIVVTHNRGLKFGDCASYRLSEGRLHRCE